jgi:pyruvate carboxylase
MASSGWSLQTVAVFSHEDRLSMHRQKADEAYMIGHRGQYTPVGAYLAGDEIIKIAQEHGVHLIHPGYGFLAVGPTKTIPAFSTFRAKSAFSERVEKA